MYACPFCGSMKKSLWLKLKSYTFGDFFYNFLQFLNIEIPLTVRLSETRFSELRSSWNDWRYLEVTGPPLWLLCQNFVLAFNCQSQAKSRQFFIINSSSVHCVSSSPENFKHLAALSRSSVAKLKIWRYSELVLLESVWTLDDSKVDTNALLTVIWVSWAKCGVE